MLIECDSSYFWEHEHFDAKLMNVVPVIKGECKIVNKEGRSHCLQIKRGETFVLFSLASEAEVSLVADITMLCCYLLQQVHLWKAVVDASANSPCAKIRLRKRIQSVASATREKWGKVLHGDSIVPVQSKYMCQWHRSGDCVFYF